MCGLLGYQGLTALGEAAVRTIFTDMMMAEETGSHTDPGTGGGSNLVEGWEEPLLFDARV